jgi:hypothetical protein
VVKVSHDALAAARNYLRGVGVTERSYPVRIRKDSRTIITTWPVVLRETAEAIQELGLVGAYIDAGRPTTRQGRKARLYRELAKAGSPPDSVDITAGQGA